MLRPIPRYRYYTSGWGPDLLETCHRIVYSKGMSKGRSTSVDLAARGRLAYILLS
jgi:hypothetical protein